MNQCRISYQITEKYAVQLSFINIGGVYYCLFALPQK